MLELREGSCYPKAIVGVNVGLACVDVVIAIFAFYQVYVDLIAIAVLLLGGALACYGCWFGHCVGSSVPSAFVLLVMRELPPPLVTNRQQESRTIAFISDGSVVGHPQCWTAATRMQNQQPAMDNNNNSMKNKLTMGRRKIEIKKIEKKSSLQVTFTKRRMGIFKKASELSILYGSEIAILVHSPANKMFAFRNSNVESVIRRFQSGLINFSSDQLNLGNYNMPARIVGRDNDEVKVKYADAVRRLEVEKKRVKEINEGKESFESMEVHELEGYLEALEELEKLKLEPIPNGFGLEALEGLRNNVLNRMGDLEKLMMEPIPINSFADQDFNNFVEGCSEEIWWR